MESIIPSLADILAEITKSEKPLYSRLAELSNLSSEELELFKNSWPTIELERRRQVIQRLVDLADDNVELNFDSIFKYCFKDEDAEIRGTAIKGLWENEEPSLISPLLIMLEQDTSEEVQATAASALGKFAMLAEHNKLRPCHTTKIETALLNVFNNKAKPIEVRRRALEAMAPLSLPEVKAAIEEAYQSEQPRLQISAIYAMGKSCDPSWLNILFRELSNPDSEVRYEAAHACGELEEEAALPLLIPMAIDPELDVQLAAIQALGKIGGTEAKKCLQRLLKSRSEAASHAAEQALQELETKESLLFQ
ncbi:MAG: HEAT repeat domain-containing protein [Chloroflexota bacterium]